MFEDSYVSPHWIRCSKISMFELVLHGKSLISRFCVMQYCVHLQVQNLGSLDDLKQNPEKSLRCDPWARQSTWPCYESPSPSPSTHGFAIRTDVASQESMKSRASLKGLSINNKRENPLLPLSQCWMCWLSPTLDKLKRRELTSGWWWQHELTMFPFYWEESSQLTNLYVFLRGVGLNHQAVL